MTRELDALREALEQALDRFETIGNHLKPDATDEDREYVAQNWWFGMEEVRRALAAPSTEPTGEGRPFYPGPRGAETFVTEVGDSRQGEGLDGRAVHAAWRDGMLAQGRTVSPERMTWETLPEQDRELDDGIAGALGGAHQSEHEGEPHEFRTTCKRCGETGVFHVALLVPGEVLNIEDAARLHLAAAAPSQEEPTSASPEERA